MSIANLKLDESAKLEFDVLITGADGVPTSRFVIEGKDYSISFPCRQVNEGVEVDIAGLKNILPAGEYPVRLEVVLENKIYTPMQDTITLEPVVEINTKTKIASQIKESVKVVGKVNVTKKPVISEQAIRQISAATDVAAALSFVPSVDMSPVQIIESALSTIEALPRQQLINLEKLLMQAESLGLEFNRDLTPVLLEKEEDVKDTSDYKLSPTGKKVKAHKIVFNKGEEETLQHEETHVEDDEDEQEDKKESKFKKFVSKHGKNMNEELDEMSEESLMEILKKTDPAGKWISDFVKSDNPKFAGKSKKERMKMALGAYYGAQKNEESKPKKMNESSSAKDLVRRLLNK